MGLHRFAHASAQRRLDRRSLLPLFQARGDLPKVVAHVAAAGGRPHALREGLWIIAV
jgi:hypothetical protein